MGGKANVETRQLQGGRALRVGDFTSERSCCLGFSGDNRSEPQGQGGQAGEATSLTCGLKGAPREGRVGLQAVSRKKYLQKAPLTPRKLHGITGFLSLEL